MRFAFTDDQLAFRDAVRDLLAKECAPEVVRAAWPDGTDEHGARKGEGARADAAQVAKVWADLAEMGVLGVCVPEAHGGLGLAETDWVLLAEETGYAALPHPFVETACVVAPLLGEVGDPHEVLGDLVAGARQAGVVPLTGALVPWGDAVTYLVAIDHHPAATDAWTARRITAGVALGDGAERRRPLADALDAGRHVVALGAWKTEGVLGSAADAERAFDRGALATAAQLVGLGRRLLDLTVGYVAERRQFGTPVGAQQAVKHHLADVAMQLRFAAPAVYGAAWSLATGAPTAGRDVSMAKALASDAARLAVRNSLQCHGAIGYTVEYDLHLYLKRAEALSRTWGDAAWHRRRVAVALGI
ncbi:MAG TPA: acyl-CoA dehydrogenase family protein [Acidimicrobiales bacterium]|mgnify:CR=1 FL=1|nr:acyl-CoA/acyl-ACP dehydrogenase [Acidimicrobiales bacterium]HMS90567.1 acyl-CoA dehydrogenase family protein [Acidimicrobiales bacterium]HRA33934.1 acyl-CoA dehydrogenase family protein [Acidimicrobiales bacterium]